MRNFFSLDAASAEYEALKIELDNAEKDLEIAIENCAKSHQQHDQAWYTYVRQATPANYERFETALSDLHSAHDHCAQVRLNYKLVKCKFKKASRIFKRLQKREERLNAKQQRGE